MLKALKKSLGIVDDVKEMEQVAVVIAEASEDTEAFTKLQAAFAEQTEQVVALTAALQEASTLLATFSAEKEMATQVAKESKMAARKAVVVTNIGELKADAFLAATEMLDDTAFEAVTQALVGTVQQEANTALFKEVGVDAKADTSVAIQESEEMRILRTKYAAQSAKH